MILDQPHFLQIGAGLVLLALLGLWSQRRRRRKLAEFLGGPRAAARLSRISLYRFRLERGVLLGTAALALATAAAEPRFPVQPAPPTPPLTRDVVFAVDISASMQASDVEPTRLGHAVEVLRTLLEPLHQDRVGLLLFAGTTYPLAPPTHDRQAFEYLLGGVTATIASAWDPGSLPSGAVQQALRLLHAGPDTAEVRTIILLSDGEAGEPLTALRRAGAAAAEQGVTIHTVGIGSTAGSGMILPSGAFQLGGPVTDRDGNPAFSRLRPRALQELASGANGTYTPATDPDAVEQLGRALTRPPQPVLAPTPEPLIRRVDPVALLASIALALLLIESLLDVRIPFTRFVPRVLPAPRRSP